MQSWRCLWFLFPLRPPRYNSGGEISSLPRDCDSCQSLIALRQRQNLTEDERAEVVRLMDVVEQHEAARAAALADLARLRGVSMAELMHTLGIQGPGMTEGMS